MNEATMRAEIEAAGLSVLRVGPLFGSELDAIVENGVGQFVWSHYRRQTGIGETKAAERETKAPERETPAAQGSLF